MRIPVVGDRIKALHPHCYRPHGEEHAIVSGLWWDEEYSRVAVSVYYDNNWEDRVPLMDMWKYYEDLTK